MLKSRILAVAAALGLIAVLFAAPTHAQTGVDVRLTTGVGTRTLYVEDMTGAPLSSLDFGTGRSMPFRVRVVDSDFSRQGFSVSATMTNLYRNTGTLDYGQMIASSDVSLGSQLNPLNVLNVEATVRPLVDAVSTIEDGVICGVLGAAMTLVDGTNACVLEAEGLTGHTQTITVPIDLANLHNLPLLPQANQSGNFTNAEYGAGVGVGHTNPPVDPATSLGVLSGSPISTEGVLDGLMALLASTPLTTVVPVDAVVADLQAQFPAVWGLLSPAQIDAIVNSTVATLVPITINEILSQTGTYISLPTLNVNVPTTTAPGDYRGTLVLTALQ